MYTSSQDLRGLQGPRNLSDSVSPKESSNSDGPSAAKDRDSSSSSLRLLPSPDAGARTKRHRKPVPVGSPSPESSPTPRIGIPDSADEAAWERFYLRYRERFPIWARNALRKFSWLFVAEDLEDIQQEVYCRLVRVAGHPTSDFRGSTEEELMAFLYRTTVHVVMDRVREACSLKRSGKVRGAENGGGPAPPRPNRIAPAKQEIRLLVEEACKAAFDEGLRVSPALRERNLRILHLALVGGYSGREIAQVLGGGISSSTVDTTLFRLRRRMKQVEPAREVLRLCA